MITRPGRRSISSGKPDVVSQRRRSGSEITLLRRRGDAVARHGTEHRLPVGCPRLFAERLARHQVDLVAVRVGVADPVRSGCLAKVRLLDHRGRPHHVEVDAVSKRLRLCRLPDPYRWVRAATGPPDRRPLPACSRARAARTASLRSGSLIRTRRSGAAARQGPRPGRDPSPPPTPPRRDRPNRGVPERLLRVRRPRCRPTGPRCAQPAQRSRSGTAHRTMP